MTESSTPSTSDIRRRRRDRSAEASVDIAPVPPVSSKVKGHTRSIPSSWGLSPTFRVLVFLGGVLGVMVFLLYNEFLIRQFRDQERDRAELYANLEEEFANKSSIPLSDMNRTLLQTGLIHHLTMMGGLGLIEPEKAAKLDELINQVAKDTLLWEVLQMVRTYWRDCGASGQGGSVDLKA